MKTILTIRPEEESQKLAQILVPQGFEVIVEPIFDVEKIIPIAFDDAQKSNVQAAIITSQSAASALLAAKFDYNIKIFAIGKQSAAPLIAHGYKNIIFPEMQNAENLKKLVLEKCLKNDGKIIYFCGDTVTLDFKEALEPLGFVVDKILAYKINWHQNFSADFLEKISKNAKQSPPEKIDFILLYSQNSAKNFYELANNNNLLEYFCHSKLLCLSPKIADFAKDLGFKNIGNFDEILALKNF